MPALERIRTAAILCCLLVCLGPAAAASRVAPLRPEAGSTDEVDPVSSGWWDAVASGRTGGAEARASEGPDMASDPFRPIGHEGGSVPTSRASAVPLPTGFSLFGAALLTLGLLGFVSRAHRGPGLADAYLGETAPVARSAEAAATAWFKIEVCNDRGCEVRQTVSARGAVDLIADLLNEGWEVVRICDRSGLSIDYEEVIRAWRRERPRA